VDVKMTFTKTILRSESNTDVVKEFDPKEDDFNELLPLVYLSGHESRFFKDSFFGDKDFKKLYDNWISNGLQSKDSKVLIQKIDGSIAGFVSYTSKHKLFKIELIAVKPRFQGQGIGELLLKAVENRLPPNSILIVPTQEANTSACFFYKNFGFKLLSKQYIYHYEPNTFQ
jgi:dTDP-4-amino-4,6-dideoxy-D-galactose acyltransferase